MTVLGLQYVVHITLCCLVPSLNMSLLKLLSSLHLRFLIFLMRSFCLQQFGSVSVRLTLTQNVLLLMAMPELMLQRSKQLTLFLFSLPSLCKRKTPSQISRLCKLLPLQMKNTFGPLWVQLIQMVFGWDHVSKGGMLNALTAHWFTKGFSSYAQKYSQSCMVCAKHNAGKARHTSQAAHPPPERPSEHLMIDFMNSHQLTCLVSGLKFFLQNMQTVMQ